MDVRNCKTCGKLFNYTGGTPLCPACMKALDDKFIVVKEYIYKHPGAGMQEVAEQNDVTIPQIQKWIREERLSFSEESLVGIACEKCGVSIRTGRFCKSCKDKIANHLEQAYKEPEAQAKKKAIPGSLNSPIRFLDSEGK